MMSAKSRIDLETILPTNLEVSIVITLGLIAAILSESWWIGLALICLGTLLLVLARYRHVRSTLPAIPTWAQIVCHGDIMKLRLEVYKLLCENTPLDHHECEILAHKIVKEQLEELERRKKIQIQRVYSNRQS